MPRKPLIVSPDHPYHLSARSNNRDWFALPTENVWEIMSRYLYFVSSAFSMKIHNFVLMDNHYHLIASFPEANMPEAMQYFMRETSRSISMESHRINHVYGGRYFRSQITTYNHFMSVYKYVYRNPVEARLCRKVENYPYSSLNGLLGNDRCYFPMTEDTLLFEGVSSNLRWLNQAPTIENYKAVRSGLRRDIFSLPMINDSKEKHPLETDRY